MDKNDIANNLFYVGFFSGFLTAIIIGFIFYSLNMDLYTIYRWDDASGNRSSCMLMVPTHSHGHRQKPYNCLVGPTAPHIHESKQRLDFEDMTPSDIKSTAEDYINNLPSI